MTETKAITDERLFGLLREADPLAGSPRSAAESRAVGIKGERLLQHILSSERVISPPARRRTRLRRRLVLSAASCGGVAAVAAAAVVVLTAGSAPTVAFAGWRADPTAPAGEQVKAAEADCRRNSALASQTPALADTRGPYTLLVYPENSGSLCVTGPHLQSPTGEPPMATFGAFLSASSTAGRSAAQRRGLPYQHPANTNVVAPDAIKRIDNAIITKSSSPGAALSFNVGRVGEDVAAVTLVLEDGSRVEATTSNGWFAAWWPGGVEAQTAEITTTSGTTTQQLIPPREYETAKSGSSGPQ